MKTIICATILSASAILLLSCKDKEKTSEVKEANSTLSSGTNNSSDYTNVPDSTNSTQPPMNITDKEVIDFVQKAASGDMMETEMGKIAMENAKSQRVKNYGAMLAADHAAARNELMKMAAVNNIAIPAAMMSEDQPHVDMMKNKTGDSFDMVYIEMMLKDHKEDIAAYEKAAVGLNDASYKRFAAKTLPVLQKHLDSAMAIQKKM